MTKEVWTNRKFAEQNEKFKTCCERGGISPSKRQASKYRRKRGKAYKQSLEWREV
jgi:hypothetical protein